MTERSERGDVRLQSSAVLTSSRIVAVLRADSAEKIGPVAEVLVAHGVRCLELTLTTPGAVEALPALLRSFGQDAEIGVGTVLSQAQAEACLDAGARFLVTPTFSPDVVGAATRAGVPSYPGGLTPTELRAGWDAGATALKVFPASLVGPGYLAEVRGPFPDMLFIPSGGVTVDNAASWLRAGAVAVSLGGALLGDALRGGSLPALAERADALRAAVDGTQGTR